MEERYITPIGAGRAKGNAGMSRPVSSGNTMGAALPNTLGMGNAGTLNSMGAAPNTNIANTGTMPEKTPAKPNMGLMPEMAAKPNTAALPNMMNTSNAGAMPIVSKPITGLMPEMSPAKPNIGMMPEMTPAKPNMGMMPEMTPAKPNMGMMPEMTPAKPNMGMMPELMHAKPNMGMMPEMTPAKPNMGMMPEKTPAKPNMGMMPEMTPAKPNMGMMPNTMNTANAGTMPFMAKPNVGAMPYMEKPNMGMMPEMTPAKSNMGMMPEMMPAKPNTKSEEEMAGCGFKNGELPPCAPLAAGFVPFQQKNSPKYGNAEALTRGTLFPGLDLPFKDIANKTNPYAGTPLGDLMALGFVIKELNLYLDTHPKDKEAFDMLKSLNKLMQEGMEKFTKLYGPQTIMDITSGDTYNWIDNPWPWEYTEKGASENNV